MPFGFKQDVFCFFSIQFQIFALEHQVQIFSGVCSYLVICQDTAIKQGGNVALWEMDAQGS